MFGYPLAWQLTGGGIPLPASSSFLMSHWIIALACFLASFLLILANGPRPFFTLRGSLGHRSAVRASRRATTIRLARPVPRFR